MKLSLNVLSVLAAAIAAVSLPLFAQNSAVENHGAGCDVSYGALKTNNPLPDPFAMNDGTRISTKEQWACRRNEIKKDLEQYEIGPKPDPSTITDLKATLDGNKLSVKITTKDGNITLTSTVSGSGNCVAIGMNGNAGNISGCRQIPFMHDQVVTYANGAGTHNTNDPFYKVYPSLAGKIGKYAAWSWGISRLIDGIEQVKDQLNVDMSKIGLQGCSYAGKMALFGGAFDERVALTVAQESGGGGINSWRLSQAFTTRTKINVEKIDNTSGSWFLSSMKNLDPTKLPHDHHELIAMIAPRAVIVLGNPPYDWLGDESGYKSVIAAKEVWKAFGVPENIGYDFTGGHEHCQAASSQVTSVNAFVNKFLKGQSANTEITIQPNRSEFSLTMGQDVINWTTPTLTGSYPPASTQPTGFTLTVNASPLTGGTVNTDPPLAGRFEEGQTVTVTAVPADGWKFDGWGGDVSDTGISIEIVMDKNKSVTAKFSPTADGTENLIKNGNFANTQNWTLNKWNSSDATFAVSSGTANITNITKPAGTDAAAHSLQLVQNGISLTQGMKYRLTFDASAASVRDISVYIQMDASPYTEYLNKDVSLTADKESFSYEFEMTAATDDNARIAFNFGGAMPNVSISNVKLIYIAEVQSPSAVRPRSPSAAVKSGLRATALSNRGINVTFSGRDNGVTTIKLYGLKGNLISTAKLQTTAGRNYSHTFNTGKLPNGFYLVGMYGNGKVEQARVVVPR